GDLSSVVDASGLRQHPPRACGNQTIQVLEPGSTEDDSVIDDESGVVLHAGLADDGSVVVDCVSLAVNVVQDAQVGHSSLPDQECMCAGVTRCVGLPGDLTGIVDRVGPAEIAAQRAQRLHTSVIQKAAKDSCGSIGISNNLAEIVDAIRGAILPAQRADVLK